MYHYTVFNCNYDNYHYFYTTVTRKTNYQSLVASLLTIIDCILYRKEENLYTLTLLNFTTLLISQLWLLYIAIF